MNTASQGHIHPISRAIAEIYAIFAKLGFEIATGPEIEEEHYNFDDLNIPKDHPARDMQDTLWIKPIEQRKLLRTHVSGIQIRYMEAHKPPMRIMYPGKVFRNEATDATHEAQFHQVEWLLVDKEVSLASMKGVISHFLHEYFGKDIEIRFRPSFFPFTEPSLEVDMKWKGKWLEIIGSGPIHPNVLNAGKIDPTEWQGFAFACGLDRLIMIKYGIPDIRFLYSGDLRLVNQF